jgi:hypothetical protein
MQSRLTFMLSLSVRETCIFFEYKSKEAVKRNQELTYENQDLKEEKQRLIAQHKHTDEAYQNQLKVTKNLELLLERLQKDKETMHTTEILKYQDAIKQNAMTIHSLQNDCNNYQARRLLQAFFVIFSSKHFFWFQAELDELKDIVAAASRLNVQLEKKDEIISYLQQQGSRSCCCSLPCYSI